MHLALLAWLMLAMTGGTPDSSPATTANISSHNSPRDGAGIYSIAAQTAPTDTVTVSDTVSATATLTQSAATPLPTASAGGFNLRINPFDWDFLTSLPIPSFGPFAWVYLGVMLVLFGISAYVYLVKRPEWKKTNSVWRRAAERWGTIGMWIGGLGLVSALFRFVGLDFFNLRFWFYLWLLAAIVAGGWFLYWYRTSYPKERAKHDKTQRAKQYMPGAAKKGASPATTTAAPASAPTSDKANNKKRRKR